MPTTRRAPPLPPDARRRAIVDAVAPLLVAHGAAVTTKRMADAAGVAEGTLFTVFDDKRALIMAVLEDRLDPEPLTAALAAIDAQAPLRDALTAAAAVVLPRIEEVRALASALHGLPAGTPSHARPHATSTPGAARSAPASPRSCAPHASDAALAARAARGAVHRAAVREPPAVDPVRHPLRRAGARRHRPARRGRRPRDRSSLMLLRLLNRYTLPYRRTIALIVAPAVRRHDREPAAAEHQRRHHRPRHRARATRPTSCGKGGWMLLISFAQVAATITAVFFGARIAMAFGRDVRSAVFHQVARLLEPRGRQLRRPLADHAQHQRRAAGADARCS